MEAKVRNQSGVEVISISGFLNIEDTQTFKQVVTKHFLGKKMVFNMEQASFVGSTGIQSFLETLKSVSESNSHGVRVVCVKSEFRKILQSLECQNLQIFESEKGALESFVFVR